MMSSTLPLSVAISRPVPVPALATANCTVELVSDYATFVDLEAEWNDAVGRAGVTHPFLRHEWIRTWWDAFGTSATLHVLIVRIDGQVAAIAPLMRESIAMYGIPIRRLRLIQNDHTPRADVIVASHAQASYRALWNALRDTRDGWDVLLLGQLERSSGTLGVLSRLAEDHGCSLGVWKSADSPYVPLNRTWEDYLHQLPAKFRSNLRNRLARAMRLGDTGLEVLVEREDISAAAPDAWRLEASGWKASAGTAISCDPAVHRFYSSLIEHGTAAGWLRLLFLRIAGRRVAMSYGASFERRLFLFKTGYDPGYAACAPFKLLTYFALRDACERGLVELDFLGDSEPWKLEWTSATRGHDWLFVFANTMRGRLVHSIKFQWGPELRRWWA